MNYDSRSTWDSGLDAGSIPARSIYCGKEGPIEDGRIPYHAGRRPRTKFVYYSVCYLCVVMRRGPPQVGGVLMTNCGKEGPIEDGRIPYHAGRRPRTKFVYYSVCYFCIRRKEAIGFFDGIEQAKKWLLDERRDLV